MRQKILSTYEYLQHFTLDMEIEVILEIARMMNFTIEPILPEDGKYGILTNDNKTYNGLLGMLQRKEAHIMGNSLQLLESRYAGFDFVPVYDMYMG